MAKRTSTSRLTRVVRRVNRTNTGEFREETTGARIASNMVLMRTGQRGRVSASIRYKNGSRRLNQYNFSSPSPNNPSSQKTKTERSMVVYDNRTGRWDDGYESDRAWTKNRLKRARARRINVAPAKSAG